MNLVIGYEITSENPRNTWRLTVNNYSGDADARNTITNDFTDKSKILKALEMLSIVYDGDTVHTNEELIECLIDGGFEVENEDEICDLWLDLAGHDVFSDGNCFAQVDNWSVSWFNHEGREFYVSIEE